jgi:hypothetical protein
MKVAVKRRSSRRAFVMDRYSHAKTQRNAKGLAFIFATFASLREIWLLISRRALLERDHVVVGFVDLVKQLLDL